MLGVSSVDLDEKQSCLEELLILNLGSQEVPHFQSCALEQERVNHLKNPVCPFKQCAVAHLTIQ